MILPIDEKNGRKIMNELVQSELSPLVQAAMSGQLDTDKLSKLLEIQERYEANEAEKAFHRALSDFKQHEIKLNRDKKVYYKTIKGETEYWHTTLGNTLQIVNPLLSQYGLSLTWTTDQDMQNSGRVTVTCVLSHALGHSAKTSLSASPDDSGGKNNIQAIGSTVSYLERYTAFSLLGLASMDQDDDGTKGGNHETISEEQAIALHAKITDNNIPIDRFKTWMQRALKVDAIEDLNVTGLATANAQIDAIIKKGTYAK